MKNNKYFITTLISIFILAIAYKGYKIVQSKNNQITKEVVTIYLKNNEIKDGIDKAIVDFNKAHDDIYIRLRLTNDDFDNVVFTKLANEYDIDIFEYNGRNVLDKNYIKPLSSIDIDLSNVDDNSFLLLNNEVIGVKYGVAMEKLMYNLDPLSSYNLSEDTLPKTLDELIVLLEKIKEDTNKVPLSLSLSGIHEIFSIVGEMSISENTTYSTFWNYETGEYDYDGLKEVLAKLNYMYVNGLISEDFNTKTYDELYEDFKNEDTFIIPVNYFKKYSVMDRFKGFNLEFSNIPTVSLTDKHYYYTYARTLVLANNDKNIDEKNEEEVRKNEKHNEAVKYVYEWLISNDITNTLEEGDYNFASFNNYVKEDNYKNLNDNEGYVQNLKDPTEVLAGNSNLIREYITKMIKGEMDIELGISELKTEINKFINNNSRNKDIDLSEYKE